MNTNPFRWLIALLVEMNPLQRGIVLLAELLTLLLILLPPSLFQSFSCEVQPGENGRQNFQSTNGSYIDRQMIVIGTAEDINQTVGPLDQDPDVDLALVEDCDLSYLNTRTVPDSNVQVEGRQLVMRLYEIRPLDTSVVVDVETIINGIDEIAQGQDRTIFADPNYLTRLADLGTDPCIRPSEGGGTGGGPYGNPGIPDTSAEIREARDSFMNQWAFDSAGINLLPPSELTGRKVRVAVFDTDSPVRWPFPLPRWISMSLPSPLWFSSWDYAGTTMANNHGLFAAGLIHRIAPDSRIQLIRVLNDDGCGDLWALNKALESYKSWMSAWHGDLDKTVINMSLGIRTKNPNNQKEVDTLDDLLRTANGAGAIIIAAAGNDSYDLTEDILKMQSPASSDFAYGVAATNRGGQLSCYSNQGDLAAPGGDSLFTVTNGGVTESKCEPRSDTWDQSPGPGSSVALPCTDIGECEFGLISLGRTSDGPQYMFWAGTSFATPLVSGLAALAYQENSYEQVKCILEASARVFTGESALADPENMGIIDLNHGLSSAVVTDCRALYPED